MLCIEMKCFRRHEQRGTAILEFALSLSLLLIFFYFFYNILLIYTLRSRATVAAANITRIAQSCVFDNPGNYTGAGTNIFTCINRDAGPVIALFNHADLLPQFEVLISVYDTDMTARARRLQLNCRCPNAVCANPCQIVNAAFIAANPTRLVSRYADSCTDNTALASATRSFFNACIDAKLYMTVAEVNAGTGQHLNFFGTLQNVREVAVF